MWRDLYRVGEREGLPEMADADEFILQRFCGLLCNTVFKTAIGERDGKDVFKANFKLLLQH